MTSDVIKLARAQWLGRLGWEFVPCGPEEWGWRKFIGPKCVAQQGDSAWKVDIELTRHLLAMQAVVDEARDAVEYGYDRGKMVAALDNLKEGR